MLTGLSNQAYAYRHFYEFCLSESYIKGLIFWGFADKDWPNCERPGVGFFDQHFNPKPVFSKMKSIFGTV